MDLSLIQDNLSDFATFGKNLGTALADIPKLLLSIIEFFDNFGDNADTTGEDLKNFSS